MQHFLLKAIFTSSMSLKIFFFRIKFPAKNKFHNLLKFFVSHNFQRAIDEVVYNMYAVKIVQHSCR